MAEKLRITSLGGLDEVGKNLTVYDYKGDMIVVDCGLGFPDGEIRCSHSKYHEAGMMQRCFAHASFQRGFRGAVSTLAFTIGLSAPLALNPQSIGYTFAVPEGADAIAGTISVGRTSPSEVRGFPSFSRIFTASGARFISSTIGRSSGFISI